VGHDIGHEVDLRHGGQSYRVHVARAAPGGRYRLSADGDVVDVLVERLGRSRTRVTVGTRPYRIVSSIHGPDHLVEVDGDAYRFSQDDGGVVRSPAAAVVVSVAVAIGDVVAAGARLLLLEAMKMEVAITAPAAGTVSEVLVAPNVQVEAGAPLLRLEPSAFADHDDPPDGAPRLRLPELADTTDGDDRTRCLELLDALHSFVLGYDLGAADAGEMARDYQTVRWRLLADESVVRAELDVLDSFASRARHPRAARGRRCRHVGTRRP
jgi:biotin carboxyl carrier protein